VQGEEGHGKGRGGVSGRVDRAWTGGRVIPLQARVGGRVWEDRLRICLYQATRPAVAPRGMPHVTVRHMRSRGKCVKRGEAG